MPPWMSREDSDEVPPPRSPLSTTAVRKPRSAASRAIPAPVIPPPMTRTSTGSAAIDASAAARVRCEKGVSLVDVLQLGPAAGPGEVSRLPGGECNAGRQRTARSGDRRLPPPVLQGGDGAQGRPPRGPRPLRGARAPRAYQSGRRRRECRDLRAGGRVGARP